jgi:anti-sigma-K factor RskA
VDPAWRRRLAAAVTAVCLTYLVGSLLFDQRQGEGPVIVVLTATHGVHSGDVPVVLAWLVGVGCCAWIALKD